MTFLSALRVVIFLAIGISFFSGCGNDDVAEKLPRVVAKGTVADVGRLTTFSNSKSAHGELVYVPIYSSVYHQTADREYLLTATMSVHNVDLTENIEISAVSYFDTQGRVVSEFLREPAVLGPLATRHFIVPQADRSGGPGANFLVKWESEADVTRPIIEAVMISTTGQQGISFTTQGAAIRELR